MLDRRGQALQSRFTRLLIGTLRVPCVVALTVCLLLIPHAAIAAPAIDRIELGFDGNYKLGYWTPLSVQLSGLHDSKGWSLDIIVPDNDGVPTRVCHPFVFSSVEQVVSRPAGVTTFAEQLYVKIGRRMGEITVILREGEREITRRRYELKSSELAPALSSDSWLLLSLGTTQHLATTLSTSKSLKGVRGHVATVTRPEQLPNQWYGYEGVDIVILPGGAKELSKLVGDAPAMKALDAWIRRGGTLLMTFGAHGETAFKAPGPIATWAPGKFDGVVSLTDTTALQEASGVDAELEKLTEGETFSLAATRLAPRSGEVRLATGAKAGALPLVVESRYGFGRVLFVAIDLDEPLLGRWVGTAPFTTGLLLPQQQRSSGDNETPTALGEVTHAGYDDLSGQLRSALDQFQDQGVRLLQFGALMGVMLAYIALLGPGDFFFLKRGLKRMELTWITLPLLIVLTCGVAYAMAVGLKGREIRMNQIDLIDYDDAQQARRATSYFTIYSPRGQAYDLALALPAGPDAPATVPDANVLISWFGLPGSALGGMESPATPPLAGKPYDYSLQLDALDEVPIPVWSTKSFMARWAPRDAAPLTAALARSRGELEGLLSGTVTNRSGFALEQCVLLTGRWAYSLGTLQPGERLAIHDDLNPRAVASHLARRSGGADQYDRYNADSERIVEIMSFYQAAGGIDYTRLKHRYESLADMSGQLADDRAVLVGLRRTATAEVRDGDKPVVPNSPGGRTVYRVIVPIRAE